MNILMAYTDAYALHDPDGYEGRKAAARQQFADAGLRLDTREVHQLTCGHDPDQANARLKKEIVRAKDRGKPEDLHYVDYEPPGYTHESRYQPDVVTDTAGLLHDAKASLNNVSVYGIPSSRWYHAHISRPGIYGFLKTHQQCPPDWYGPQFYQPYNIEDKAGTNNLHRILQTKNVCHLVSSSVPVIPFVQPVIRHRDHDYQEMSDATALDMWSALMWAGIRSVVWWYESGGQGQLVDAHAGRIQRHAEIIKTAQESVIPGA